MQYFLKNWRTKKELERIAIFHWAFFAIVVLAEIIWMITFKRISYSAIYFIVLFLFSVKALKSLYYSFWTFAFFMFVFVLASSFHSYLAIGLTGPFYFYLLAMVLFVSELFSLHTPIYYPLVNWWEYDFRFRSEIKIKVVTKNNVELEGRLTDLRRMAGCVVLFDELKSEDVIQIITQDKFHDIKINAEIISKRTPLPGRGTKYGVRFLYASMEEKKAISDFVKYWHRHRQMKKKLRFLNGKDRSI